MVYLLSLAVLFSQYMIINHPYNHVVFHNAISGQPQYVASDQDTIYFVSSKQVLACSKIGKKFVKKTLYLDVPRHPLAFFADRNYLWLCQADSQVQRYNLSKGKFDFNVHVNTKNISTFMYDARNGYILTGTYDGNLDIYSIDRKISPKHLRLSQGGYAITSLSVSPKSNTLCATIFDRQCALLDLVTFRVICNVQLEMSPMNACFDSHHKDFLVADGNNIVRFSDKDGQFAKVLSSWPERIEHIYLGSSGDLIFASSRSIKSGPNSTNSPMSLQLLRDGKVMNIGLTWCHYAALTADRKKFAYFNAEREAVVME